MLTVGHGRLSSEALGVLLTGAGVRQVVDVRRFPGSRANPAAARGAIAHMLHPQGIVYRWDQRLGGRRRLLRKELETNPDTWWQVEAFRSYAAWTRSADFREALDELAAEPDLNHVALMCSESVWWRCHRRIIADVAVLERGWPVQHLMHDGRLTSHPPSEGARLGENRQLVWDGSV